MCRSNNPRVSVWAAACFILWCMFVHVTGVRFDGRSGRCLPGGGPPVSSRKILAHGVQSPIIIEHDRWTSHELLAAIGGILTEEVLGFEVAWFQGGTDISSPVALSGCNVSSDQPLENCSSDKRSLPKSMINLEYWNYQGGNPEYNTATKKKFISSVGPIGFLGRNGLFVNRALVLKAWEDAGEVADHYRGWQGQYAASQTRQVGQNETWNRWSAEQCARHGEQCDERGVILSPSCESARCGTLFSYYPDYAKGIIPQLVNNLELQVGLQWLGDEYEAVIEELISAGEDVFFYFWTPSEYFNDLSLKLNANSTLQEDAADRLFLPTYNPKQHKQYRETGALIVDTDFETSWLKKLVWSGLSSATAEVHTLVKRMSFNKQGINELLGIFARIRLDRKSRGLWDKNATMQEAACEWLHTNKEQWLDWIDCGDLMGYDDDLHGCKPCGFRTSPAQNRSKPSYYPRQCMPCDVNDGSNACNICPRGQGLGGNSTCTDCPAGTFSEGFSGICSMCPPDTYSRGKGSTFCIPCTDLGDFYQEKSGQGFCKSCPKGTELYDARQHGAGIHPDFESRNMSFCVCKETFWRPDGQVNNECSKCPDGAECPSGTKAPIPLKGFWAKYISKAGDDGGTDSGALQLAGYPHECEASESGNATCDVSTPFFLLCPMDGDGCMGGHGAPCTEQASGNRCENCAEGFFSIMGSCQKCFKYPYDWLFSLSVFALVVVLWILTNMLTAGSHSALDIGLQYMQYVSTVQGYNLPWDDSLLYLTKIFAVFNFSIDFVSMNCIMPWSPQVSFSINMYLPIVWMLINTSLSGLAWFWLHFYPYHEKISESPSLIMQILTPAWAVGTQKELQNYWWSCLKSSLNMLTVVYNSLCIASFQPFVCRPLADGTQIMMFDSSVYCSWSDPAYVRYVSTAGVALIVYVAGIPAGFFALLHTLRRKNVLYHDWALGSLGWLYTRYEPGLYFWELVILARRFVLSAIAVFIYQRPDYQVTATTLLVIAAVAAQFYYRPFVNSQVDVVDCIGLLSLALYVLSGQMMQMLNNEHESRGIAWFLIAITGMTMAMIAWIFKNEYQELKVEQKNGTQMTRIASEAYVYLCLKMVMIYRTKERMASALRGNTDQGQTHIDTSQFNNFLQKVDDDVYGHEDYRFFQDVFNPDNASSIELESFINEVFKRGAVVLAIMENCGNHAGAAAGHFSDVELREIASKVIAGAKNKGSGRTSTKPGYQQTTTVPVRKTRVFPDKSVRKSFSQAILDALTKPQLQPAENGSLAAASSVRSLIPATNIISREVQGVHANLRKVGGELAHTIESCALQSWLHTRLSEEDWDSIFNVLRLDACMSESLGDGFECGAYSYSTTAIVFRRFMDAHPAVVGWLLNGNDQDVESMRSLMATLVYATEYEEAGGHRVYNLIQETDRGPFLYWLVEQATPEQRQLCRNVMTSINDLQNEKLNRRWWKVLQKKILRGEHSRVIEDTEAALEVQSRAGGTTSGIDVDKSTPSVPLLTDTISSSPAPTETQAEGRPVDPRPLSDDVNTNGPSGRTMLPPLSKS